MLVVDTILVGGLKFVLSRIVEAVEAEMNDDSHMREELLAAQMKLELGEITEDEFVAIEAAILQQLRVIQERKRGSATTNERTKIGIESVSTAFDRHDDDVR